jgi:RND superfamily putative drug exporter
MGQDIKEKIRTEISSTQNDQLAALREQLSTQMAGAPQVAVEQVYNQSVAQIPSVDTLVEQAYPFNDAKQKVVDGEVLLQATLKDPASSLEARQTIVQIREALSRRQLDARVGGVSAIQLDTNTSSERDLYVVIPLILAAITAVLMLLLRSIVAPLVLLLTTVLSFGTTLGVAALLFNHVWQYPGADPSVVIFGFVFLVALGIDYNIFLMTRVREETARIGVRTGTLKALVVTGGVITSAGIVLASTFAALYVIPILFLAQIAFIVAFGVLLDTVVVRSLLVPALTLEIGRPMWWPSKLAKKSK